MNVQNDWGKTALDYAAEGAITMGSDFFEVIDNLRTAGGRSSTALAANAYRKKRSLPNLTPVATH